MAHNCGVPRMRQAARYVRRLAAGVAALGGAVIGLAVAAPAHASIPPGPTCTTYQLSVALTDPGPADQTLWGQLCYRGVVEPNTVQLLVPGSTYSHIYWNFPSGNGYFSYVDAATLAGYATFDVDRVGIGNSSHPVSSELTVSSDAVSLHDVITDLRAGAVDGHRFSNVIWVSHSLGSMIGAVEISTYHDVSAAILTGFLNAFNPNLGNVEASDIYPAIDDPQFAGSGLDPGYLTTKPGTREALFYDSATADPGIVTIDEATKQTETAAEGATGAALLFDGPSESPTQQITVPVLLVAGQFDNFYCQGVTQYNCDDPASVQQYESLFYSPQADLQIAIVPGTGHDLALSTTAPVTDAILTAWALRTVAP